MKAKTKGKGLAVALVVMMLVAMPALASLNNSSNASVNENESITTPVPEIPTPSQPIEESNNDTTTDTDTEANVNETEIIIDNEIPLPPLSENLKFIGKDSFSVNETPEFVIEIAQAFIDAVSDADSGKPVEVQISVEDCNGVGIELSVEEVSSNKYCVTIPNNKTSEIPPGIYTLIIKVGEQSVEHAFEWGLEPETEPGASDGIKEPLNLSLSENLEIIGKDSFSANETPEFVIELEQSFMASVSDADSGEPVKIQIYVEGCNGSRIELFVEEIAPNKYRVTIPNNKTGLETEEITPGTYTLVVEVGGQSVEHPFEWGLETESKSEEALILPPSMNLSDNLKFFGNDSFSANETPEFVIEIQNDFIASVANLSDSKPAIQIHAENSEGNRIEVIVEEISSSSNITNVSVYKVTIPNNKTGSKFKPGTYKLVVELGGQSIEYPFEWGPQPTIAPALSLTTAKKHFVLNENPVFKFKFNYKTKNESKAKAKTNETGLKPLALGISEPKKALKTWISPRETIKTAVYYNDELLDLEPEIEKLGEGDFSIKIPSQRAFRAGLYKLKVVLVMDNKTYVEEQDFTWGVLAINTHKSIYLPDETAFIGIAVLDNEGHMVCDADVTLTITDPGNKDSGTVLSTGNGLIKVSPQCSVYGVTNLPDYYTNYVVGGVGTYVMTLTAVTTDGTGTKSITDEFTVQSSVDFDVARSGPTRIYPPVPYVMNFTIKANKNYNGLIKEYVPALFEITTQEGLTVTTVGDTKILTWNKNLVKGEVYNIYYEFDAPDISPYLFILGRLQIGSFEEKRDWMIASDADTTVKPDSATSSDDGNVLAKILDDGGTYDDVDHTEYTDVTFENISAESISAVTLYFDIEFCDTYFQFNIDITAPFSSTDVCIFDGVTGMQTCDFYAAGIDTVEELNNLEMRYTGLEVPDTGGPDDGGVDWIYLAVTYSPPPPPASITNLHNTTYASTYINWSWTNPGDGDFNHTMVYINGNWKENVSLPLNYSNATGLSPNTNNTISTHTVDTSGNVNQTWVNHSAWTAPSEDTTAPIITNENLNRTELNTGETVRLNATTSDHESDVTEVKFKIKYPDETSANFSATKITTNYWEYNFSDTSQIGQYNWTDTYATSGGGTNHTTPAKTFNVYDVTQIPTNKLYESSTSDFSSTAEINLSSSRDGTANNVYFVLASSNLYTFVNATSNAIGTDIIIPNGSNINFSANFSCGDRVNYAYLTWKFYKLCDSTETLICKKGNDSTGGVQLPDDGIATLTGSCAATSNVTLNSTDKLKLVLNVYAHGIGSGGAATTKKATHYWDSNYESWVQYEYIAPPKTNATSVNTTAVGVNDIICVNHTVTKGTYDIDKTWVEITYPNGTSANITTSNTTGVCGAGGNIYGVEINVGLTLGNLTVNTSWVNDTQGNIDYDDPYPNIIVSVKDIKAPQWSDANTNKTTIYEGDYVKFTANWTDDVDLAGYKFSTNQSGTWVNSSFIPFSGTFNISENVTQITASAGTTVGWRFYANDTSDNGNATDIQSFVVESAEVITPVTPYMIYGRVFYKNGSVCDNPALNITNMNNSKQWQAETNASYNYYQIALSGGSDLNATEILQFNVKAPDASQFNTTNHTVTPDEIDSGGLFSYNITLEAPETPFIIYGWVNYSNGTACNGPTVTINNTNTSTQWQAETNASYNFYQLILDTTNISVGNVLEFNATDGSQYNVTNHTVTQKNITDGGLFDFNLTLPSATTEGPDVVLVDVTPDHVTMAPCSTTTMITVNATVSDPNGVADIKNVNITNFNPSISGVSLPIGMTKIEDINPTTAKYQATVALPCCTSADTYTVTVEAKDKSDATDTGTDTFTVYPTRALSLNFNKVTFSGDPDSTDNPGTAYSGGSEVLYPEITSMGNDPIDVGIFASNLTKAGAPDIDGNNMEATIGGTPDWHIVKPEYIWNTNLECNTTTDTGFRLDIPLGTPEGAYTGSIIITPWDASTKT